MAEFNRIFIHGLESSSQGNKGQFFRKRYPDMIIEDFSGSLENRMIILEKLLSGKRNLILVGSSFGGLMAAIYACRYPQSIHKLILLAPALDLDEFRPFANQRLDIPTTIFHSENDDIVPMEPVVHIAKSMFTALNFNVVDDDHPLSASFPMLPWDELLAP